MGLKAAFRTQQAGGPSRLEPSLVPGHASAAPHGSSSLGFGVPAHLEAHVPQEVEVPGVHPEVFQDEAMGQVIGKILGEGEVTEAGHLLGGVGDD